jgi:hypothetical protein
MISGISIDSCGCQVYPSGLTLVEPPPKPRGTRLGHCLNLRQRGKARQELPVELDSAEFAIAASLRRALTDFIDHFHAERNHQGKGNVLLFPTESLASKSPEAEYAAASA